MNFVKNVNFLILLFTDPVIIVVLSSSCDVIKYYFKKKFEMIVLKFKLYIIAFPVQKKRRQ